MSARKSESIARGILLLLTLLLLSMSPALAREEKEHDSDVNYDENKGSALRSSSPPGHR